MGIIFFEHNRKAYDAAIAMPKEEGKVAVIHPTGTGKSSLPLSWPRIILSQKFVGWHPVSVFTTHNWEN